MKSQSQEKNTFQECDSTLPRFLRGEPISPERPLNALDELVDRALDGEIDLDARDVAHHRPGHKFATYKRTKKRIAEMEELHELVEKKTGEEVDNFLDKVEGAVNSMVE